MLEEINKYLYGIIQDYIKACEIIPTLYVLEDIRELFLTVYSTYIEENTKNTFFKILKNYVSHRKSLLIVNNNIDSFVKNMEEFEFSEPPDVHAVDYLPSDKLKLKIIDLLHCIIESLNFRRFGYGLLFELYELYGGFQILDEIEIYLKQKGLECSLLRKEEVFNEIKQIEEKLGKKLML